MRRLTASTRGSALALCQTNWAADRLKFLHPDLEIEVRVVKTKGDKILDVPLAKIGDKGLFVKELEQALLRGEIDFAVHSMKDVPTQTPDGLCIAAVPERVDPSDAFVSARPRLADLPGGARVGTSSLRRRAQLQSYRPDLRILDLRGNLDTRLRKLDAGQYDAIVVACAGLYRMGWADRITEKLPLEICLPAVGQGALAIQARQDDSATLALLAKLDHADSRASVLAERSLMSALGGGCQIPVGALASVKDGPPRRMTLAGVVASLDGARLVRAEVTGDPSKPEELGIGLANVLLARGADDILRELRSRSSGVVTGR